MDDEIKKKALEWMEGLEKLGLEGFKKGMETAPELVTNYLSFQVWGGLVLPGFLLIIVLCLLIPAVPLYRIYPDDTTRSQDDTLENLGICLAITGTTFLIVMGFYLYKMLHITLSPATYLFCRFSGVDC